MGSYSRISSKSLSLALSPPEDDFIKQLSGIVLVTRHYDSLVDVRSSQTTTRRWELSREEPGPSLQCQQLRGGNEVVITIQAASHEECLKDDDTEILTINFYLSPVLILKVGAAMIVSALQ